MNPVKFVFSCATLYHLQPEKVLASLTISGAIPQSLTGLSRDIKEYVHMHVFTFSLSERDREYKHGEMQREGEADSC